MPSRAQPSSSPVPARRDSASGSAHTLRDLLIDPEIRSGIRILIIDDERTLRESCASVLRMEGYDVATAGRADEAIELLQRKLFDIVLIDLYMPDTSGLEVLSACLKAKPDTLCIVMTGHPSITSSVEALRKGAWDYLPKPFSATHLQILVGRAAHTVVIARETHEIDTELERRHGHRERASLLGRSPPFVRAVELARKVARTDASVFITGESGTGKEMIAQFIHHHSRRSSRQLVALNCAALPESLLESEMFGHVKGAFTGAVRDKPGLLESANGGTLFLDELTEMSQAIQAKLLRVIQDGVVRRVGSEGTNAVVNVRFIAATNRHPQEAIADGHLRKDLYYRLGVVPIDLPALRERPEDIPILADHFITYYWHRYREGDSPMPRLSQAAIRSLQARPWPGNVRELQNVVEHTVVLLESGSEIRPDDIPSLDGSAPAPHISPRVEKTMAENYHAARDRVIAEFEQGYLSVLIESAKGNMSEAARIAGVDRTTLYRLMERHRLQRKAGVDRVETSGDSSS